MSGERDEVIRVGIRLVVVGVAAGLLVLALSGTALSQELLGSGGPATGMLVSYEPLLPAARIEEAEQLLRDERRERVARAGGAVVDLVWSVATSGSPRRLLSSGKRLAREVADWNDRSTAEDRALTLIEGDVVAGTVGERGRELYERLRSREDDERVSRWLREAEATLAEGRFGSVRRRLDWTAVLRPEEPALEPLRLALSEALDARDWREEPLSLERIEDWEADLTAALLTDQYDKVLAFESERADVDLAQAAALYLAGEPDAAIIRLERLEERGGRPANLARIWLADGRFNPEALLVRSERRFRVRRALGVLGGGRLEKHGLSLSRDGYKAWQDALSPLNLAVSLPARLLAGRRPEAVELRAAAASYLNRIPFGPRADAARAWLDESAGDATAVRNTRAFDDGRLVLPRSETPFQRLNPLRLAVTPRALEAVGRDRFARLGVRMDSDTPVVLISVSGEVPSDAITLPRDTALRLAAGLAHGLENGTLAPVGSDRVGLLEGLRRLDVGLRRGAVLVVEPWVLDSEGASSELSRALVEGGSPAQLRQLSVARSSSSVRVERELFARSPECPEATLCVDRARIYQGRLYARLDDDGEMRLGLGGRLAHARLTIEIGRSGPHASVVLPLGNMLGVGRWLPAKLRLKLGVDGLAASPRLGSAHRSRIYAEAGR